MDPINPILGAAVLLLTIAGGYTLSRVLNSARRAAARPRVDAKSVEAELVEIGRANRRLEQENHDLSTFFVTLPDLVRKLESSKDKNQIAAVLIQLLDVIFEPHQACVFYRVGREKRLWLADAKGLAGTIDRSIKISFQEGRVGYVAENQVLMDSRDFLVAPNFQGDRVR